MELKTRVTRLQLRKSRATTTAVYDVLTPKVKDLPASAWRSAIQEERRELQKHLGAAGVGVEDAWKAADQPEMYNEKAMIEDNQKWPSHVFYASDIAGKSAFIRVLHNLLLILSRTSQG